MNRKYLLLFSIILLSGCVPNSGNENEPAKLEPVILELISESPIVPPNTKPTEPENPEPPPVEPPPVEPPDDGTGMTEEEFNQLKTSQTGPPIDYYHEQRARSMAMRQRFSEKPEIKILGEKDTQAISLPILPPPKEMTACNRSIILGKDIPVVDDKIKYNNGWWLLASTSSLGIIPIHNENAVYFYWARQIATDEVGVVYSGFATTTFDIKNPPNIRIFTGNVTLSYQWISHIMNFGMFPHMPGTKCD